MVTGSLFKYVNRPEKLRILASSRVSKVYTVATLLRNFHCCLYGNQTSCYFRLTTPDNMLANYINQIDFES